MANKVMEHRSTDEEPCDDQKRQADTENNQIADIRIARFVAPLGLFARPAACIHDDICPLIGHWASCVSPPTVIPSAGSTLLTALTDSRRAARNPALILSSTYRGLSALSSIRLRAKRDSSLL